MENSTDKNTEENSPALQNRTGWYSTRERRQRLVQGWGTLSASITALAIAAWSLYVALDASSRYELTSTFGSSATACIELGGARIAPSVIQDAVITNTGRLPITIVEVFDSGASGGDFYWSRINTPEIPTVNSAVELNVGQSIAVRVVSPGDVLSIPLVVVTTDGRSRALSEVADAPRKTPEAIVNAFRYLPECSQKDG
ncbi:hypothetical protein [Lysinibacter sp. HNR]|uniref:hypothetical protein n=1 Tax=Lysinibacter sp. HNR TaxID=3031408 RepID=UPI0024354055|nr:hypothetical protein [Lysinibacter sp. HNR]WGD36406.1 hypothetical protein FrondiHNR_07925 [Lysinibacter sp. HNR]